ncbi:single-stranded DNA-binding protein [Fusobacterium sp. PH5-44]|uniref:single-stranded DNA-binding protein n=1 Tax=unclassified Fusobacterium TaxID=2648384 RepID=UPI003D1F6196
MNNINLIGRLTKDLELKYGQSGKAYAKFSLAVKRNYSKDGVDFINCVSFGKTAEIIAEHLRKGNKIAIEGSLQMNQYESNGEKRTTYEVLTKQIHFLESKKDDINSIIDDLVNDEEPF